MNKSEFTKVLSGHTFSRPLRLDSPRLGPAASFEIAAEASPSLSFRPCRVCWATAHVFLCRVSEVALLKVFEQPQV